MAYCETCGLQTAAFNLKRDPNLGNGTTDLIGGMEKYEAICRNCFINKTGRANTNTATHAANNNIEAEHRVEESLNFTYAAGRWTVTTGDPPSKDCQNNASTSQALTDEQKTRAEKNRARAERILQAHYKHKAGTSDPRKRPRTAPAPQPKEDESLWSNEGDMGDDYLYAAIEAEHRELGYERLPQP